MAAPTTAMETDSRKRPLGSGTSSSSGLAPRDPKMLRKQVNIPGFEDLRHGVVRTIDNKFSFVDSTYRLAGWVPRYFSETPLYHYELLSKAFRCTCKLKLENLQRYGDLCVRSTLGIIVSNYYDQLDRLSTDLQSTAGVVVVVDPSDPSTLLEADSVALLATKMKLQPHLFVASGALSLGTCAKLFICQREGAQVHWVAGDGAATAARAVQFAQEQRMVYIDHRFNVQYSLIGAATTAHSILQADPALQTLLVPVRNWNIGWSHVTGVATFIKMVRPSVRVVVCQLDEPLTALDDLGQEVRLKLVFPDILESAWTALLSRYADPNYLFDVFDVDSLGTIKQANIENIVVGLGGDLGMSPVSMPAKPAMTETDFKSQLGKERWDQLKAVQELTRSLFNFGAIESLLGAGLVDQHVKLDVPECAHAWVRCLEFTHTLTNGKGAASLAGLWSGQVEVQPDENVVALVCGGYLDPIELMNILDYSLGILGLHFNLNVTIPHNSTALAEVLKLVATNGIQVYDTVLDHLAPELPAGYVSVLVQCRGRNFEQQQKLLEALRQQPIVRSVTAESIGTSEPLEKFAPLEKSETLLGNQPQHSSGGGGGGTRIQGSTSSSSVSGSSSTTASLSASLATGGASSTTMTTAAATTTTATTTTASMATAADSTVYQSPFKITDVTPMSIQRAYDRVKGGILQTPIHVSTHFSRLTGCSMYLMFENIQKTGSFKIRGSSNMLLKALEFSPSRPRGLVAASAGNHAQGVALAALRAGLPCTIVCPNYAPETKLRWTRSYGAEVLKVGESLEEAGTYAEKLNAERGWLLVRPYNDVDIIEGQGTMGYEIFQRIPDVDTVVVNVGGGGMIAGIALYLKQMNPNIRIVGVQSEAVAPLATFKQTSELRYIPAGTSTLADGTNVKLPGGVHTQVLRDLVDQYVTVSENEIASTIVQLLTVNRVMAEGAGCLGLAAMIHKKIPVRPEEKVCVIICGGNLDVSWLRQLYQVGLRDMGRDLQVRMRTSDFPGSLARIVSLAAQAELNVREIRHKRGTVNWDEVIIICSFTSHSFRHQIHFLRSLVEVGIEPKVVGRKQMKDGEQIYAEIDDAIRAKRERDQTTLVKKSEEFAAKFRATFNSTYS